MDLPKLFESMDFATYLSDPAPEPSLSSSTVRDLLETAPRKVWETSRRLNPDWKEETARQFDLGKAAHGVFVGHGDPIRVIDFDSYRKAEAKEERDAAYAVGAIPVLAKEMDRVTAMAAEAERQFGDVRGIGPRLGLALREASIFWMEAGVTCRSRPDFFIPPEDYDRKKPVILHYKTTGATISPYVMARFAANQGWDMIAAHYEAGVENLTGIRPEQIFLVQENVPPYLCMAVALDDLFLRNAYLRRRRALTIWAHCVGSGVWPGHSADIITLELPGWHENNVIAAKDHDESQASEPLNTALHWQAPQGWKETIS